MFLDHTYSLRTTDNTVLITSGNKEWIKNVEDGHIVTTEYTIERSSHFSLASVKIYPPPPLIHRSLPRPVLKNDT